MKKTAKLSIFISIVLISLLAISTVSAANNDEVVGVADTTNEVVDATPDNDVQKIDNTKQTVETDTVGENSVKADDPKSFTDLENDINNGEDVINLKHDYAYNETLDTLSYTEYDTNAIYKNHTTKYTAGVLIRKNCTIDGEGHYIDGANQARIFAIDSFSTVILKNIIFINGSAKFGGAIYSSGKLTIDNCTFIDNHAVNGGAVYINDKQRLVAYLDNEEIYNEQLDDPTSALSQYYYKWPREDGIDSAGNPVRDSNTLIVGHSYNSHITAPGFNGPFLAVHANHYNGNVTVYYGDKNCTPWANIKNFVAGVAGQDDLGALGITDNNKIKVNCSNTEGELYTTSTLSETSYLTVSDSKFINNVGTADGKAINTNELSKVKVENTEFVGGYPTEIMAIAELQNQLDELQKQIDELKLANTTLNQTVTQLKQQIAELKLANQTLNSTVTLQEQQIKALQENMTKLKVIIDHIDDLEKLANNMTNITKLIDYLDTIEKLANNMTNITKLIDYLDTIEKLANNMTNITKLIDYLDTIEKLANNMTNITQLAKDLDNITQVNNKINDLTNSNADLQKNVTEINKKLEEIKTANAELAQANTKLLNSLKEISSKLSEVEKSNTKVDLKLKTGKISKKSKKVKLTATLKINGKVAKRKLVVFTVNGKAFTAKTNNKGVAKVTLKKRAIKSILKGVKTGAKISCQVQYGPYVKAIKVKK